VSVATITALCTAVAAVITAVVALIKAAQQAGLLKAHLAGEAHAAPPAAPDATLKTP